MHYLDNSATTQVCPEAAAAALGLTLSMGAYGADAQYTKIFNIG